MTVKELMGIAKDLGIVGRHGMRKQQLIDAIVEREEQEEDRQVDVTERQKNHDKYIFSARVGMIIAFKINGKKVLSGKIEEIHATEYVVRTKNGVKFHVNFNNVLWVKTGERWPKSIYLMMRGEQQVDAKRENEHRRIGAGSC